MKRVAALTAAYLVVGAVATAVFYWLTGVAQFGDVFDPVTDLGTPRLAMVPQVLEGFLLGRLPAALLDAVALSWCIRKTRSTARLLAIGAVLPLLYEVLAAQPFSHSWVGMAFAVLRTWPTVPEYVMPARLVLRTAVAYLGPAALAGLVLSAWVLRGRPKQEGTGS